MTSLYTHTLQYYPFQSVSSYRALLLIFRQFSVTIGENFIAMFRYYFNPAIINPTSDPTCTFSR